MGGQKKTQSVLQRRLRVLQRKHRQLAAVNTSLRLEDHILSTSCAGLAALRQHIACEAAPCLDSQAAAHVRQLQEHEAGLLAQLAATDAQLARRQQQQAAVSGATAEAAGASAVDDRGEAFFARLLAAGAAPGCTPPGSPDDAAPFAAAAAASPTSSGPDPTQPKQQQQQVQGPELHGAATSAAASSADEEGRQLVAAVRAALMEVSVHVHTLTVLEKRPATTEQDRRPLLQRIRATWTRHIVQAVVPLLARGRYDLIGVLSGTHFETLERLREPPPSAVQLGGGALDATAMMMAAGMAPACLGSCQGGATPPALASALAADARVTALLPVLQLTDEQLISISMMQQLLQRQLEAVMLQRQQLLMQAQLLGGARGSGSSSSGGCAVGTSTPNWPCSTDSAFDNNHRRRSNNSPASTAGSSPALGGGSSGGSSTHNNSLAGTEEDANDDVLAVLARHQAAQRQLLQLQVVLRKEALLHFMALAWLAGCLSWQQLSRAVLLQWPHPFCLDQLLPGVVHTPQPAGARAGTGPLPAATQQQLPAQQRRQPQQQKGGAGRTLVGAWPRPPLVSHPNLL